MAAPKSTPHELGFSMPAKVMQYRKMIEERATFADALERARSS